MTVNTVSPAIISRAEFNLNAGQKQNPQLVRMDFTNLVTNGGFDTDTTGWTALGSPATFAVQSGRLRFTAVNNNDGFKQTITTKSGASYLLTFDYEQNAGDTIYDANTGILWDGGASISGTGSISHVFVGSGSDDFTTLEGGANNADYFFDDFKIYEVDPSDDAPWLRLPYGYSVGRTGWIVRDGVVLHPSDYTEVKDSGQTWIKPLVAPGVSTEFSIWGSPSYAV